jgi:hypothetical protein
VVAWILALSLASTKAAAEGGIGVSVAYMVVGWLVVAPLAAAALRWAVPAASMPRLLLVALGWPSAILVGVGLPFALRLANEGVALLGLAVAVAGIFGALALVPSGRPIPWDRVVVVAAAWCAGWLWSGTTAWPAAFWLVANGYSGYLGDVMVTVPFLYLVAGGVMSGLAGGVLMFRLLRPVHGAAAP